MFMKELTGEFSKKKLHFIGESRKSHANLRNKKIKFKS